MNKWKTRSMAVFLSMSMICSTASAPAAFAAPVARDIAGHWAQEKITKWTTQGYISGYPDGTFRPNSPISRAEFVVLVNKTFQFSSPASISFSDVPPTHWAYDEIKKGVGAGYIKGADNARFRPDGQLTRQEAAVILSQVKGLYTNAPAAGKYTDFKAIDTWAKGYVGAVTQSQIMSGFPDGSFRPLSSITRAETVVSIDKGLSEPGRTASRNVTGSSTVSTTPPSTTSSSSSSSSSSGSSGSSSSKTTTGTTSKKDKTLDQNSLSNETIQGDLIIPSNIGYNVKLEDVTVNGTLVIEGGSTITAKNCKIKTAELDRSSVTLKTEGRTTIDEVIYKKNGEIRGSGFKKVTIANSGVTTATIDATVDKVYLDIDAKVKLLEDADIDTFEATEEAGSTTINFTRGANVDNMELHSKVRITGRGDIGTMTVYKSGVRTEIDPDKVKTRNNANEPVYTRDSSSSGSSSSGSSYDNVKLDKDEDDYDGDGERVNNLTVRAEDSKVSDVKVYGNLTIASDVGNSSVTLNQVEVRGTVYIYGGGENSIIFRNCDIQGDIVCDPSKKDVSSKYKDDPVALKFDDDTTVGGKISILGNTRIQAYSNSSKIQIPRIVVEKALNKELYISQNVTSLELDKTADVTIASGCKINTVKTSSDTSGSQFTLLGTDTLIDSMELRSNANIGGNGTVNKITTYNNAEVTLGTAILNPGGIHPSTGDNSGGGGSEEPGGDTTTVKVTGVTVTPAMASIRKGGETTITATIAPNNATNKTITWSSSDPTIAKVEETGKVTGVKEGNATITATTKDGNFTASCDVTVLNEAAEPGLDLTPLYTAITSAMTAKESVVIAESADTVEKGKKWVTKEVMAELEAAIETANKAKATVINAKDVQEAAKAMAAATEKFVAAQQDGTKQSEAVVVNKIELKKSIDKAENYTVKILVSETGVDVPAGKKWVTSEIMETLKKELEAAKLVHKGDSTQDIIDSAKLALDRVIAEFEGEMKGGSESEVRRVLGNAITTAENSIASPSGAMAGDIASYQSAIDAAKRVYANVEASSEEISIALNRLYEATELFKAAKNKARLLEEIERAKRRLEGVVESADGTDVAPNASWATKADMDAFKEAIQIAEEAYSKNGLTGVELEKALSALVVASGKFNPTGNVVDKGNLNASIRKAEKAKENVVVSEENGDDVSSSQKWVSQSDMDRFNDAIKTAKDMADTANATKAEVSKATEDLENAIKNFKPLAGKVDKSNLLDTIDEAKKKLAGVIESPDGNDVGDSNVWATTEQIKTFEDAISTAESVYQTSSKKSEIDRALDALKEAMRKFDPQPGNVVKVELREAIDAARDFLNEVVPSADGKTVDSSKKWATAEHRDEFNMAIGNAETVEGNSSATKSQVLAAIDELEKAREKFESRCKDGLADRSELKETIKTAEDKMDGVLISKNGTDVSSDDTWVTDSVMKTFKKAIEEAKKVYNNPQLVKDDLDDAVKKLEEAIKAFKPEIGSVNKKLLKETLDNAQKEYDRTLASKDGSDVPVGEYWVTQKTKYDLGAAIQEAELVYKQSNTTSDKVNKARDNLFEAYNKFMEEQKKKEAEPTEEIEE